MLKYIYAVVRQIIQLRNREGQDMKSFFIRIVFLLLITATLPVSAGVRSVSEQAPAAPDPSKRLAEMQKLYQEIPDLKDPKAVREYLKKRLKLTSTAEIAPNEVATPSSTSTVDTHQLEENAEKALSAYEKIYRDSLQRAGDTSETVNEDVELKGTFYRLKENQQTNADRFVPDFPYVTVKLSKDREILAPADEHFP